MKENMGWPQITLIAATAAAAGKPMPTGHGFAIGGDVYPMSRCLDGSDGRYYVAVGAETTKFLIFHEGG
jgi:hypothetical protein